MKLAPLYSTIRPRTEYDGDGKRVMKARGVLYWYGSNGTPIPETDASGNTVNEYVFFGGRRIAHRDGSGNVSFYFGDHLGTARVITTSAGTVCYDADFYPFGGEMSVTNTCSQDYEFTGHERDSESGLDHTLARKYNSCVGRWLSPDPIRGSAGSLQTWNRYTYALNSPTTLVDSLGLISVVPPGCIAVPNGDPEGTFSVDCPSGGSGGGAGRFAPILDGPTAGPGGASKNASGGLAGLLSASVLRVAKDLGKPGCAAGFKQPLAPCSSAISNVLFENLGPISPQGFTVSQQNQGQIILNSQVNWASPQPLAIQFAEAQTLANSITPAQLMDLAILHELEHYQGTLGNPDTDPSIMPILWQDCVRPNQAN